MKRSFDIETGARAIDAGMGEVLPAIARRWPKRRPAAPDGQVPRTGERTGGGLAPRPLRGAAVAQPVRFNHSIESML
ncbi:hypothetical protein [Xylophilus sp.]|uniref:hypothetical protein n=1 Tax=Xylophilus sp. TaxID=2653893 RepID=UPI0013B6FA5F|nr:hypothetical protein [Xylophilus sp.]KAF1048199.1 MAG: hypothetical protein GAK38_01448 [Xylophilus sp.]